MVRPYRRKVNKINKDGEILETYDSIKEAAEDNYISTVAISRVLSGARKTAASYYWSYAN